MIEQYFQPVFRQQLDAVGMAECKRNLFARQMQQLPAHMLKTNLRPIPAVLRIREIPFGEIPPSAGKHLAVHLQDKRPATLAPFWKQQP